MRSEDFSDEELAQAMQPKPTPVPQQTVPQQTVPQQMHEISKNASLNPLQEVIKSESKPELDGNYWPIENLPSKYKLYPPGTKLYARPLKVLEVKMLSSLTNENFHHIITEVLKKTVKGIEVENLLVADKLFISPKTVDNHRTNLLSKTNTKNSANLVMFAIKNNLIEI